MDKKFNTILGVYCCCILLFVLIEFKLIGAINWSWCWVLTPLWIPTLIRIIVFLKTE